MDSKNSTTTDLLNILARAMDSKIYGSVEVYLEEGQITQITQRIIKKIKKEKNYAGKPLRTALIPKRTSVEPSLKFQSKSL